jgi:hypothetical protein
MRLLLTWFAHLLTPKFHNEQAHSGFEDPWSYLIVCRSFACKDHLYANEASVEVEIHKRIKRTKSGSPALKYFDGATMGNIQQSIPKAWETLECRTEILLQSEESQAHSCDVFLTNPQDWTSPTKALYQSNLRAFRRLQDIQNLDEMEWLSQLKNAAKPWSLLTGKKFRSSFDPFSIRHVNIQ